MRGVITPVNRNGINRVKDISVLRKASYEETADILFGAAVFSEKDYLTGISEKIIFGQATQIGTSNFRVMIDCDRIGNYVTKAEDDKKELMYERSVDYEGMLGSLRGDRTPIPENTPYYEYDGARSIFSQHSPSGFLSPAFTPHRGEFTPQYEEYEGGFTNQRSPGQTSFPSRTPLNQTPSYGSSNNLAMHGSPVGGSSYYTRNQCSGSSSRSPYYQNYSNSPNYSSIRQMSQSPSYSNSPMKSSYSSPNYGSTPNESVRRSAKEEEEDQEDDDF